MTDSNWVENLYEEDREPSEPQELTPLDLFAVQYRRTFHFCDMYNWEREDVLEFLVEHRFLDGSVNQDHLDVTINTTERLITVFKRRKEYPDYPLFLLRW